MSVSAELDLASWRRATAEMYAEVRARSRRDPAGAWRTWAARRNEMFAAHPQSPLASEDRAAFAGIEYFLYDPEWNLAGTVSRLDEPSEGTTVQLPEGVLRYRAVAAVEFEPPAQRGRARLTLYWVEGYGGGLFLPFGDATNGTLTYGGGRYLYDTIKGADLGAGSDVITLDFNYSYNPSCAYSPRWVCPLAPKENRLGFAVEAGERSPSRGGIRGASSLDPEIANHARRR